MKLLVIGNCQARPVSQVLASAGELSALAPIVIHLAKAEQKEEHEAAMDEADIILAQHTAETFEPSHLISSKIAERHPSKTKIWPNIFFLGQQPFLRYVNIVGKGRLLGPMDAYHDLRILRAWFKDRKQMDFAPFIEQEDYAENLRDRSLADLESREKSCDIRIADLVRRDLEKRHLFFTFNHPTSWLLKCLCNRILNEVFSADQEKEAALAGEPLGRLSPPSKGFAGDRFQGLEVSFLENAELNLGGLRQYSADQLDETFRASYDHLSEFLIPEKLRISPPY